MITPVQYSIAISEEHLGETVPVPLQGGLLGGLRCASSLGFDAVEIHVRSPLSIETDRILQTLEETGIKIVAVGTGLEYTLNGLSLTSEDEQCRRLCAQRFREHIDLASGFGATVFVGLCRGSAPTPDACVTYLGRLRSELRELVVYAERQSVVLSLEPIVATMTNLLNSTDDTLSFIDQPGLEPVRLLLDTHHMYFEDADPAEALRTAADRIEHLHISDSNRRYPGSGAIDFVSIGEILKEIGYCRGVSLEILPDPSPEVASLRGLNWMQGVWERRSPLREGIEK